MFTKRISGLLTLLMLATLGMAQGLENFKLNEVVQNNKSGLVDEYGSHTPWIEIANTSWSSTDLCGCYITNDPAVLDENMSAFDRIARMSLIPKGDARTNLAPKGHLVLFADGDVNLGTLHTKFALQPGKKNFVALYEGNGVKLIDSVWIPANLATDCSFARFYDSKSESYVWKVCKPNLVTPNTANDNTSAKEDKVAQFKEKDPYGVAMSILGMGIVFGCLILLCVFFAIFGVIASKIHGKDEQTEKANAEITQALAAKPQVEGDESSAVIAVIGMALYEELDAHDEESDVITIVPSSSPWKMHEIEIEKEILN